MATIIQEARIELSGRESLTLGRRLRGHRLQCISGELWLTVDGEGQDVILGPGTAHTVDSNAELVVSAFRPSVLRVSRSPRPAGLLARLAAAFDALLARTRLSHLSIP